MPAALTLGLNVAIHQTILMQVKEGSRQIVCHCHSLNHELPQQLFLFGATKNTTTVSLLLVIPCIDASIERSVQPIHDNEKVLVNHVPYCDCAHFD